MLHVSHVSCKGSLGDGSDSTNLNPGEAMSSVMPMGDLASKSLLSVDAKIKNQEKFFFFVRFFCKMYPSLGCGALSAKCTAGANILGYFLFPWPWHWTLQKPPLLQPPFLGS